VTLDAQFESKNGIDNILTFEIENSINSPAKFDIGVSGKAAGWISVPSSVIIGENTKEQISFSASIPNDAKAGDYDFTINVSTGMFFPLRAGLFLSAARAIRAAERLMLPRCKRRLLRSACLLLRKICRDIKEIRVVRGSEILNRSEEIDCLVVVETRRHSSVYGNQIFEDFNVLHFCLPPVCLLRLWLDYILATTSNRRQLVESVHGCRYPLGKKTVNGFSHFSNGSLIIASS
jgi:hypothetical protein